MPYEYLYVHLSAYSLAGEVTEAQMKYKGQYNILEF